MSIGENLRPGGKSGGTVTRMGSTISLIYQHEESPEGYIMRLRLAVASELRKRRVHAALTLKTQEIGTWPASGFLSQGQELG